MMEVPLYDRGRGAAGVAADARTGQGERAIFIDNLLVRIHIIIVMIRWTGLAPLEFELPFPGSLTSTFLDALTDSRQGSRVSCLLLLFFFMALKPRVE